MADDEVNIIKPPDTLKEKIILGGPGAIDLEALERAEAVIASMANNYLEWVEEDLVKIQKATDVLKSTGEENRKALLDPVFHVAHDIKGQGGSFNYNLMTVLGNGLCRFIEKIEKCGQKEIDVIQLYIDTMKIVISKRMSGDGGQEGEKVLKGLDLVAAKILK